MNIFDRYILKAHIVPRKSLTQSLMVHFNRLYFSVTLTGAKDITMAGLRTPVSTQSTGTEPIPPILKTSWRGPRKALLVGQVGGRNAIQSCKECYFTDIAIVTGDFPFLEPRYVSTWLQHVVTIPTRNWHKF
ncbi:unnamed protein product [Gulo gulo]|uniref:Uncharacterized protein n=1 Tax=Gulo gulo TaxID=48420 RepID=A0A9X9LY36_GULGU|nr:unnamed protein product [Gulo gulo]